MENQTSDPADEASLLTMSQFEQNFKFYLLLFMHIPSLLSGIFIIYHFNWTRRINQIFGILLIVNTLLILTELPFTLTYLHQGYLPNINICPVWILINYTLFIYSIILTTWASIERYLFIYHERFISHHFILLHYVPVVCLAIYTPLFYVGIVLFYPCEQAYNVYSYLCAGPCYLLHIIPCLIDWCINALFILSLTCVMNILLIVLNVRQRHRMRIAIITTGNSQQWRRTLKLSFQLFSISSLFMLGWIPYGILSTMQIFFFTPTAGALLATYFIYFPYVQTLFLPYSCLLFMPKIRQEFTNLFYSVSLFRKIFGRNRVQPLQTDVNSLTMTATIQQRRPVTQTVDS